MTFFAQYFPSLAQGLDWTIRASLVFATASLVVFALRNRSAATRHLVWSVALLGVLLLPLLKSSLPGWSLPSWSSAATANSHHDTWLAFHRDDSASRTTVNDMQVPQLGEPAPANMPAQELSTAPLELPAAEGIFSSMLTHQVMLVPIIWSVGAAAILAGMLFGAVSLWHLRRAAQPLPPELAHEFAQLTRKLGLRRRITGLITPSRSIPMTWGALRPVVLLPVEAAGWSQERRRMVLLHELAHVQRWDFAVQLLGQISRAMHWFNPLAWWALSRLRLEQERACDDFVLNAGESATDYATELVTVTARLPRFSWDSGVALAIRRFARIEKRLVAILDDARDRRPPSAFRAATLVFSLAVIVSLVAVPRWPSAQADETAPIPTATVLGAQPKPGTPATSEKKASDPSAKPSEPSLTHVRELIRQHFPNEIDSKRLTEAAIKGMLESLQDPYSTLLTSDDFRDIQTHLDGRIVGIGAHLEREQDAIVIVTPLPNSPAMKVGLKPRDVILSVNGTKVTDLKETVNAIRGPQGSEVKLQIRRDGQELTMTVTRDVVQLGSIRGLSIDDSGKWRHWLNADAKLGYARITEFNHRTGTELELILARLRDQSLKGLVLDLRGCPGGLLEASVKVSSAFLKTGTVASIRGRQSPDQAFTVDGSANYADLPLVVLVDEATASAAEALAAALQDHTRAIVVGERTFGKGSVQTLIPVSELDANLKLTTAQMHRPNGSALHRSEKSTLWGVDPNDGYFVPLSTEQRTALHERRAQSESMGALKMSESLTAALIASELADPVLAAAFQALSDKVKTGEFKPSGRPLAEMQQQLATRDTLRAERDQLLQKLQQLDQQLGKTR